MVYYLMCGTLWEQQTHRQSSFLLKISASTYFVVNLVRLNYKKTGNLRIDCLECFAKVFTNLGKKFPTIKLAVILLFAFGATMLWYI